MGLIQAVMFQAGQLLDNASSGRNEPRLSVVMQHDFDLLKKKHSMSCKPGVHIVAIGYSDGKYFPMCSEKEYQDFLLDLEK